MRLQSIALVFPGQGSQYVGMGKDFFDGFETVREIFGIAGEVLGYDLAEFIFRGSSTKGLSSEELLNRTLYTQPAILTTSYACFKAFEALYNKLGWEPGFSVLAGHSLGEYTALLVAEAMDFRTCLQLVHKRALFITELAEKIRNAGLMALVDRKRSFDTERIHALCKDFSVFVSSINSGNQVVLGGPKANLLALSRQFEGKGRFATFLNVEGPFHTPLMRPAAERLREELAKARIRKARIPVLANVTADLLAEPEGIRDELYKQVYSCIDWRRSIKRTVKKGIQVFIEIGPRRVLRNMISHIEPSALPFHIEDLGSLRSTLDAVTRRTIMDPRHPPAGKGY